MVWNFDVVSDNTRRIWGVIKIAFELEEREKTNWILPIQVMKDDEYFLDFSLYAEYFLGLGNK